MWAVVLSLVAALAALAGTCFKFVVTSFKLVFGPKHDDPTAPLDSFLHKAQKAVPAVRWAIGVGGVVAVIGIIKSFKINYYIATLGFVIMMILMTMLVIFTKLASQKTSVFQKPALLFTWFSLFITMATALALFCSAFIGWPLNIRGLMAASLPK